MFKLLTVTFTHKKKHQNKHFKNTLNFIKQTWSELGAVLARPFLIARVPRQLEGERLEQVVDRPRDDDVVVWRQQERHDDRRHPNARHQRAQGGDGVNRPGPGQLTHGELQVEKGNSHEKEGDEVGDEEGAAARLEAQIRKSVDFIFFI